METSGLLKARLQAVTDKHHIQEDIRRKKQELEQEKLRLQHLKKKSLREQWLLQDSIPCSVTVTSSSQQQSLLLHQKQAIAVQFNILRIEKEVEYLQRQESMISAILDRLKSEEKCLEDAVKEDHRSFVPDVSAMPVGARKAPLARKSPIHPAAPKDPNQHTGMKIHDDGRKLDRGGRSPETERRDRSIAFKLSANEVRQLIQGPAEACRGARSCSGSGEPHFLDPLRCHGNRGATLPRNRKAGMGEIPDRQYSRDDERRNQCYLPDRCHPGNPKEAGRHYDNHKYSKYSSYQDRGGQGIREDHLDNHRTPYSVARSNGEINSANGWPPARSHDHQGVSSYQQLYYTPSHYIPLNDYISVDREDLCGDGSSSCRLYSGHAHCDRVPSPLYADDTPYTILNTLETTEPITAVFMGFQTTQDDSHQSHGSFEGSLQAELVIIGDPGENGNVEDDTGKNRGSGSPLGDSATEGAQCPGGTGGKWLPRSERTGVRKVENKLKACCAVC